MSDMELDNQELTVRRLLAFAGPAVPLAMLIVPVVNYLPTFYVTEVGISLYWTGLAFMFANLWDGLTDIFIGSLSDRTRNRFGKRKIWMLVGILPLLISIYYLFNAPIGSGKQYLIIWISIFYVFWTVVQVPYMAWGAELTTSYRARSKVFGFREMGTTVGIFLTTALPLFLLSSDAKMSEILRLLSYSIIGLLPVLAFLSLYFVNERPQSTSQTAFKGGLLSAIKTNKSYSRFLAYHFTFTFGVSIFNAVLVLFIQYYLGLENSFVSLVFIAYVAAIICMPICVRYAHYFGRHRVLGASILLTSLSLAGMIFIPNASYLNAAICFTVMGFSTSAAWAMPPAIVGDLADLGNCKGYGEQTATYMAGFNLVYKLGMGFGVGVALPLLQYLGFQANSVIGLSNSLPLVIVCCIIPIIIMTASVALIWNFPVDSRRHSIISEALKRKKIIPSSPNQTQAMGGRVIKILPVNL